MSRTVSHPLCKGSSGTEYDEGCCGEVSDGDERVGVSAPRDRERVLRTTVTTKTGDGGTLFDEEKTHCREVVGLYPRNGNGVVTERNSRLFTQDVLNHRS